MVVDSGRVSLISSAMESEDKEILAKVLASPIGDAVSQWAKKNGVEFPVEVYAELSTPTLYLDENGVAHNGNLVTVNVTLSDEDDDDDEY